MSDTTERVPFLDLALNSRVAGTLTRVTGVRAKSDFPRPEKGEPGYDGKSFALYLEGEWEGQGHRILSIRSTNVCDFMVKDGIIAPPDMGVLGLYRILIPAVEAEFVVKENKKTGKPMKVYNVRARGGAPAPQQPTVDLAKAFAEGQAEAIAKAAPGKAAGLRQEWWDRTVARLDYALARAEELADDPESVRTVGISLFIEASRAGVDAPPPPPNQDPTTFEDAPVGDEDDSCPF